MKLLMVAQLLAATLIPCATFAQSAEEIEAARGEKELLVFTNLSADQWAATVAGFGKKYPWIEVKIVDLGSSVFERFYADSGSGVRTGDMIVSGGADNWLEFIRKGMLMEYEVSNAAELPAWSKPEKGLYTYSADPAVLIHSKPLLGDAGPKSVHDLARLLEAKPELAGRLSTSNIAGQFARGATWAWLDHNADGWDVLAKLGPATRPERTVGPVIEKVASGEYAAAYFVSGATLFGKLKNPAFASVVGWSYPTDGTPVIPRLMGIAAQAKAPNAAKLMVSYLLTGEGQTTVGEGGATPYRTDIDKSKIAGVTYQDIVEGAGGEANIARETPNEEYVAQRQSFLDRWRDAFKVEQ